MADNRTTISCSFGDYHVRCNIDFTQIGKIYDNYHFYFYNSHDFDGRITFPENVTTSLWRSFRSCENFNSPVVVPNGVTNCDELLLSCKNFNQPITLSNTVISVDRMLGHCFSFNRDVILPDSVQYVGPFLQGQGEGAADWKFSGNIHFGNGIAGNSHLAVFGFGSSGYYAPWKNYYNGHVTFGSGVNDISFHQFFSGCTNFNTEFIIPPNAIDCSNMFSDCHNFNHPVSIPDKVNTCSYMFQRCNNFDSPVTIGASVISCFRMFYTCRNFNQPIIIPGNVENCYGMFDNCRSFNSSVTIPGSVTNCGHMFHNCPNFNQPVTIPDGVTNCDYMFYDSPNFNCDLYIPDSVGYNYINIVHSSGSNFKATVYTPYGGNCGLWPHPYDVGATIIDRNTGKISVIEQVVYNDGRTREFWSNSGGGSGGGSPYAGRSGYDQPTTIPEGTGSTSAYFYGCTSYDQDTSIPSSVVSCYKMFSKCSSFNSQITFESSEEGV